MKPLLLILSCLFKLSLMAQVSFCHVGSEWNFLFTQAWNIPWATVNENIKYNGYSLENTDTVKFLNHTRFFAEVNTGVIFSTSIKQKSDTVYMKNNFTNNQYQVLYNFAAQAGQTWTNTFTNGDSFTTTVVNSGTTTINTLTVKQLTVNYSAISGSKTYTYSDIITERYGSRRYLFNYISRSQSDGDMVLEALCYKDNEIGLKQFSTKPCSFYNLLGLAQNNVEAFTVFPNPFNQSLSLEAQNSGQFEFFDVTGKLILSQSFEKGQTQINTGSLPNGIYIYKSNSTNKSSWGKLVRAE